MKNPADVLRNGEPDDYTEEELNRDLRRLRRRAPGSSVALPASRSCLSKAKGTQAGCARSA